ncbi:exonuclease SbcCD subunit D C-terminal domain-containing protein [Massilia sp. TS11]|uniref:exonuclease SbcCD subunit D C-terminal domain-containing protein n=1 Tax=Massilia sp. TS11 TaxID=2908003 RepID=UPI001EDA5CC4|nr:exonuclease SbcCD subunit D C-terminal domain-containing protein [Massilia sp. TS11]MCG2583354.1 exonuclease SbcCD subunit D C-terminal domain-containing protein [Massilia sp. TS11]
MRLLHTSDWHLGQSFHNFERQAEHQHFLDWLLAALQREQPDALLIAGDVFDNSNPPASALRQFYRFLQQARCALPRLQIVVIAGNHDSPQRLEAPQPLLEDSGVVLVGPVPRQPDGSIDVARLVLPLRDASGAVAAWCLAIPFLRPGDVARVDGAEDPYLAGIAALYQQAASHALQLRQSGQALIAMGHCHLAQTQASPDSERRIVIGGSEALPASLFGPEIDYVALGHLHLAQQVGRPTVRYSGSPLPLSFSEIDYPHQVLRVDLGAAGCEISALPVPRAVPLLRVPARHAPLDQVLAALAALDLPATEAALQPFLEVRVLLDKPLPGLRAEIEQALAGKAVRLARIDPQRAAPAAPDTVPALSVDQLRLMAPQDVFARLYAERYQQAPPPELAQAFAELLLAEGA